MRNAIAELGPPGRSLALITTGGTIFQRVDPATGSMAIAASLEDILPEASWLRSAGVASWEHVDLAVRSGAELTFPTIFRARDAVRSRLGACGAFVLVTGTDTLEEFAFVLELLLGAELVASGAALVVTGAMKPFDVEGYDGRANLQQAIQVSCSVPAARFGVLVALNDAVHMARAVVKRDSQLLGSFASRTGGPVAQVRSGRVCWYAGSPPAEDGDGPLLLNAEERAAFAALDAAAVEPWTRVGIWTTGVAGFVPEGLLREVVGLVVAAPGTGSLSTALTEALAAWTARLPIVLVSRCGVGLNYDDAYYRGSLDKYTARGFLVAGGFEHLSAVQARNLLILRLAAGQIRPSKT
ncbi:hypothetical protein HYH03_012412 [Edaphochlamys debaryana]|uniref:asparaginase n=1 Tax=Edaphochlamys debaryana TaxID=47281 RepID=A0A835XVM5_9CHLO|nr:hypothetical protein HYH03_012412 [Edaphochlamys debaryana]|eukprot:KAG2489186.1 hypothetical protein HYH03_012412 [Edaphochlamys debaryana]